MENTQLTPFEGKNIRTVEQNGELWFSVTDIIAVLTESVAPNKYWSALKKREPQLSTICRGLKFQSVSDNKFYKTDCANTEGVLRIVQSVPSPKAEPFKLWLAGLGRQAIEEANDPELGFERLRALYQTRGYSDEWIGYRLKAVEIRRELTEEWKKRGITEGVEYAQLTASIAKETFGLTPSEHAELKGLQKENLRDHMTNLELIFTALSEESTRAIAEADDAQGFHENQEAALKGGNFAGNARKNLEKIIRKPVVSAENFLALKGEGEAEGELAPPQ
jgi:DNA-damage-inducible protein D